MGTVNPTGVGDSPSTVKEDREVFTEMDLEGMERHLAPMTKSKGAGFLGFEGWKSSLRWGHRWILGGQTSVRTDLSVFPRGRYRVHDRCRGRSVCGPESSTLLSCLGRKNTFIRFMSALLDLIMAVAFNETYIHDVNEGGHLLDGFRTFHAPSSLWVVSLLGALFHLQTPFLHPVRED